MKSTEDIQKLADSALETIASNQASEAHPSIYKEGFVDGYEQCESEKRLYYSAKNKKEIECLARIESNDDSKHAHVKLGYQDGIYYGFIEGYVTAQNNSEKKYTLEDMRKMFNHGYGDNDHLGFDHYINKI
jgi:ribosomal protein S8